MSVGLEKVTDRIEADLDPVKHPSWSVSVAVLFDLAWSLESTQAQCDVLFINRDTHMHLSVFLQHCDRIFVL